MKGRLKEIAHSQDLLVKSIPLNGKWLLRVFSDTLYYTQTRYNEIRFSLTAFLQNNYKQFLKFLSSFDSSDSSEGAIENYISQLMVGNCDFEITLVLL